MATGNVAKLFQRRKRSYATAFLSTPEFLGRVAHERSRSDRTGSIFSVVVITSASEAPENPASGERAWVRALRDAVIGRIREIDCAGWYDASHIGILLPATDAAGAATLIDNILRTAPASLRDADIATAIHTYPPSSGSAADAGFSEDRDDDGRIDGHVASDLLSSHPNVASMTACPTLWWKRVVDVAGATLGLVALSPVFLVVAGYIKLVSRGPVIFRQMRVGRGGVPFECLKFRTMHDGSDRSAVHRDYFRHLMSSDCPMTKLDGQADHRIIPGGCFLRSIGIDELPQLVNVIRGDMSLVGPRPCIPYEADGYLDWHRGRFDVRPGLTGLWQVSGKNRLSFDAMIRLDIAYAQKLSFRLDMLILAMTVPVVLGIAFESLFHVQRSYRGATLQRQGN
jgi:lipopolysaccharide/colanic/teichoic acid biosynthesis glycosyltransferase